MSILTSIVGFVNCESSNFFDIDEIVFSFANTVLVQILEENIKKQKISSDSWSYATSPNS
jgi:hypothetical protein